MAERPPLESSYLIQGSDRSLVETAVRRLRRRVIDEGGQVETLSAAGGDDVPAGGDDVVAACNALGLLGGTRLILVRDIDGWDAATTLPVIEYLAAPAPETVLALVARTLKAGSKLAAAVAKAGRVLAYEVPDKRDLPGWLRAQAERVGLAIDAGGVRRLLELGGEDVVAIQSELEKLALLAGGRTVTARTVDAACVLERELPPWDLTDALGARDLRATLAMLGRFLDRRDGDVARWLPALARHLRQLYAAKLVVEAGGGAKEVARRLGMRSDFPARKLCQQVDDWTLEELSDAIVRIARAERETRGESQLRDRLSLERALVESMPARR